MLNSVDVTPNQRATAAIRAVTANVIGTAEGAVPDVGDLADESDLGGGAIKETLEATNIGVSPGAARGELWGPTEGTCCRPHR
jgi:hypothetical protein